MSLLADLDALRTEALAAFTAAGDAKALEAARVTYLGSRGRLKEALGRMKEVPKEERPLVGQKSKDVEAAIQAAFEAASARVTGAGGGDARVGTGIEALKAERLEKLKKLEAALGPGAAWGSRFPAVGEEYADGRAKTLVSLADARKAFPLLGEGQAPNTELTFGDVCVGARVMLRRDQSKKLIFLTVQDQSGSLQVALWNKLLDEQTLDLIRETLDLWDIVGVEGHLAYTQKGEPTLWAKKIRILTKCILPPPDKHHGIHDKEIRYRQRYLDLITNEASRQAFVLRAKAVSYVRRFLDDQGFLEMETPVLQTIPGGAAARPFETHLNSLNMKMYLRIATEIPLKKLMIGGLERVYELGRIFRNEGLSMKHNPEFTTVEIYQSFGDLRDMMALTEGVVSGLAQSLTGSTTVTFRGKQVKLGAPWPRLDYCELLKQHAGVEYNDEAGLDRKLKEKGLDPAGLSMVDKIDGVFGEYVEPHLHDACFITRQPVEMSPLCKAHPENAKLADRFEAFAVGMELGNAYSELNDPIEQRQRLSDQVGDRLKEDIALLTAMGRELQQHKDRAAWNAVVELTKIALGLLNLDARSAQKVSEEGAEELLEALERLPTQSGLSKETIAFFDLIGESHDRTKKELVRIKDRLLDPALLIDEDFLCAMEHGMPPAGGLGIGIDRVVMLLAGADSIRDVIPFPLMRPEAAAPNAPAPEKQS